MQAGANLPIFAVGADVGEYSGKHRANVAFTSASKHRRGKLEPRRQVDRPHMSLVRRSVVERSSLVHDVDSDIFKRRVADNF
jgi:hypothetical protein